MHLAHHTAITIATQFATANAQAKDAAYAVKTVTHFVPQHLMSAEQKAILNQALAVLDQILDQTNAREAGKNFDRWLELAADENA